jgi:hypothetical protein
VLAAWSKSIATVVFTMAPRRRVTDGLYRELCRCLLGQLQGMQVIELHLDVAKLFDHISRFP